MSVIEPGGVIHPYWPGVRRRRRRVGWRLAAAWLRRAARTHRRRAAARRRPPVGGLNPTADLGRILADAVVTAMAPLSPAYQPADPPAEVRDLGFRARRGSAERGNRTRINGKFRVGA